MTVDTLLEASAWNIIIPNLKTLGTYLEANLFWGPRKKE